MVGLLAILRALGRATWRDLRTFQSIVSNNFFLFVALLMLQPKSAEFLILILGFLLLFPLSEDPLNRIPPDRLASWPLNPAQRIGLRLASLGLSPVMWITVAVLIKTAQPKVAFSFLTFAAAIHGSTALGRQVVKRAPQWHLLRRIPNFPGRLGGMIRNNVREMWSVLDPFVAMVLCLCTAAYRFLSRAPDPGAFPIMALVVALALSTYGQCLFGLDGESGLARYRLLPLRGWEILLAKDIAYLAILSVLVLPLDPLAGITSGLAALAIGHHPSVLQYVPQRRWRFTSGTLFPFGILQAIGGTAAGFAEHNHGFWYLPLAFAAYAISLAGYGLAWDRQVSGNAKAGR